jgi:hypothetical protein
MAVQYAVGTDGSLTLPTGVSARINSWQLTLGQAIIPITGFDSARTREVYGGLMFGDFSATGTPKYNLATTNPLPVATTALAFSQAGASATFQVATGCTIAAVAVIGAIPISSDVNGACVIGYSGSLSGAITVTWDETP